MRPRWSSCSPARGLVRPRRSSSSSSARRVYPTILTPMFGAAKDDADSDDGLDLRRGCALSASGSAFVLSEACEERSPGGADGLRLETLFGATSRARVVVLTSPGDPLRCVPAVSAQLGTPVASPLPTRRAATTLPPRGSSSAPMEDCSRVSSSTGNARHLPSTGSTSA